MRLKIIIFGTMGRIMAIDFGMKRTGIAVTDPEKIIATGLTTVASHELMRYLENYLNNNEVECFVVGEPKQMNNLPSASAPGVNTLIKKLRQRFVNIPVERIDERFTSKMAARTLIDSGLKKSDRQKKELIDVVSATIILQSYLEKRKK